MAVAQKIILCVDDEIVILDSLKMQLSQFFPSHYIIEVAEGGEEALSLMEELKNEFGTGPDVLISDQIMPKMQGDELLQTVSELYPSTKAILLTGQAEIDDLLRAVDSKILYHVIQKPWSADDLKQVIIKMIEDIQKD